MILALTYLEKFHLKPYEAAFSTIFFRLSPPEVVRDVVSGANVGQAGEDVPVKFGDSRSNNSRDIRLPHFVRTTTTTTTTQVDGPHDNGAKRRFCLKTDKTKGQ